MASNSMQQRGPVYSSLADDPEMSMLIEIFVDALPDRAQQLLDCVHASAHDELRRAAHQLVGAAGSYGFHEITVESATLEAAIREGRSEQEIAAAVNAVADLCLRARAGTGANRPGPNPAI